MRFIRYLVFTGLLCLLHFAGPVAWGAERGCSDLYDDLDEGPALKALPYEDLDVSNYDPEAPESIWRLKHKIELRNGQKQIFPTLSFDSEISVEEYLEYVFSLPKAERDKILKNLSAVTGKFSIYGIINKTGLTKRAILKKIRTGIQPKDEYDLADFSPSFVQRLVTIGMVPHDYLNIHLRDTLAPHLRARGLRAAASMDGHNPEIRHAAYEQIPREYLAQVKRLHEFFPTAQTHFHLAIPAQIADQEFVLGVARAVEARITLGLLQSASEYSSDGLAFSMGVFSKAWNANRGLVKLERATFKEPFEAYDLEIRQWENFKEGFGSVEMAVRLMQLPDRDPFPLVLSSYLNVVDTRYGSVPAVLFYAARVFGKKRSPEMAFISRKLEDYAGKTYRASRLNGGINQSLPASLVEEIEEFLRKHKVFESFTHRLWLRD